MDNKFKNTQGQWLTKSLFVEWNMSHLVSSDPLFSIKSYDHEKDGVEYPSLKKLYLSFSDPTEYEFAEKVLGGWEHWTRMLSSPEIAAMVEEWREELEVKLRSEAIGHLQALARGDKGMAAAKYLAERGWESKRGRPSKEEVERQKRVHAGISKTVSDDAERLGIH